MIDRDQIMDDLENIQLRVDKMGFKGQNEYDLHLREEIADYVAGKINEIIYDIK